MRGATVMRERPRVPRELPHSIEAEEALVGAVLLHPRVFSTAKELVCGADFWHPGCGAIYDALVDLDRTGVPIDQTTVLEQLRSLGSADRLRQFGGADYLVELAAKVITTENLDYYAKLVREKSAARRALQHAQELCDAISAGEDPRAVVEVHTSRLEAAVSRLEKPTTTDPLANLRRAGTTITDDTIAARTLWIPTGIAALDGMLGGGFHPGELTGIIAPPGMGKTTLALGAAEAAAEADPQHRRPVLYAHAELSAAELEARMLTRRAARRAAESYTWRDVLTGRMPAARRRELLDGSLPVDFLRVRPTLTVLDTIAGTAQAIADRDGRAPFVVVDFVQALGLGADRDLRRIVAELAYGLLERVAEALRTPLLVVSSTARGFYGPGQQSKAIADSNDPRDFLSSGKEAGELEYSAATLMYLSLASEGTRDGWREGRIAIAKSRMGGLGFVPLRYHGPSGNLVGDEKNTTRLSESEREILEAIAGAPDQRVKRGDLVEQLGGNRKRRFGDIKRLERLGLVEEGLDRHLHLKAGDA